MRKLMILVCAIFIFGNVVAQQSNYENGSEIYIDNILTFKCKSTIGGVVLSNKHDIYTTHRNQRIPNDISDNLASGIVRINAILNNDYEMLKAFYETFTQVEINSMADEKMMLSIMFNNNGDIVRLSLGFSKSSVMHGISPQKYAILYKKIKQNVKFNVTDTRLYYNSIGFNLDLNKVKNRVRLFHPTHYVD